jgi:predicted MFS family arabinose efflux permease
MLIGGPISAALAYIWMALGHDASLLVGVIVLMVLLGISFAALVAPLTTSILSSVVPADEGLAAGVNNATSRVAQLTGHRACSGRCIVRDRL